ncbi:MAG: hypothetical protein AB1589_25740 [Cyanobacteriota bacterium]
MPKFEVAVSVQITEDSGIKVPPTSLKQEFKVEAYDKIEFNIASGEEKQVEIINGDVKKVSFLLIQSSEYSEKLTYGISNEEATFKGLDQPHIYLGKGAISVLSNDPSKSPSSLTFKNTGDSQKKALIGILVGRDATQPQQG